jgi:hypothetical protein
MISSTVAHAVALVKSHMSDFDAEILRRDFPIVGFVFKISVVLLATQPFVASFPNTLLVLAHA